MRYGLAWLGFILAVMSGSPIIFIAYMLVAWFGFEYEKTNEEDN